MRLLAVMKFEPVDAFLSLFLAVGCLSSPAVAGPILSYGDYDQLRADRPLTPSERSAYRRAKILNIFTGADVDLLDRPEGFSNLKVVTIENPANEHILESLARNYKNIGALSIKQSSALSAREMSMLPNFKKLTNLELHCTLSEPTQLKQSLPSDLQTLWLSQNCELPRLTKLGQLNVADCSVNADFFEHLDAPNLTDLDLLSATIEDGALDSLKRFKHLSYLSLPSSCRDQRERISKLTSARIYVEGDGSKFH